jgi:hypothetical protein
MMYTYTSTRKKSSFSRLKSVVSVMLRMEWRTMTYTQRAMRVIYEAANEEDIE